MSDIENLKVRNLYNYEIKHAIDYIINNLNLLNNPKGKTLLISFMGAGEPLLNIYQLLLTMDNIKKHYKNYYKTVRFAIASLIPTINSIIQFTESIKNWKLDCKFHFSLHFTNNQQRKEFMPSASKIRDSLTLLEHYTLYTGNQAEIHYALMDGVNDTIQDMDNLLHLIYGRGIPVKFLLYNEKESLSCVASNKTKEFRNILEDNEIETEFYIPPGRDIGSSCGMFLVDLYKKYNIKE